MNSLVMWSRNNSSIPFTRLISLFFVIFIQGCSVLDDTSYHIGAPGYLEVKRSMYDGSKSIYLEPASLFDADDSLGTFRLGFFWEPSMNDRIFFIISIPVHGKVELENLKNNVSGLFVKVGNENLNLKETKNSITVNERDLVLLKEYKLGIRYLGDKKLLKKMLTATSVVLKVEIAGKSYEGRFDVNGKNRQLYRDRKYTAYSGASRFLDALPK